MPSDDPAASIPADTATAGPPLADRVRGRLEREGLRPEAAADAMGIPTARLIALLQGGTPNFGTQQRIEAWLVRPAASADSVADAAPPADAEVAQPPSTGSTPAPSEAPSGGDGPIEITVDALTTSLPATPPAKRRGRPPKVRDGADAALRAAEPMPTTEASTQAALTASMPKRRGRPPKARPPGSATTEPTMPKRRGRPPKNRDQAAPSAPKRRGRPPKAATLDAPKRRGRPPKSASAQAAAPKRRGRPPKHPQAAAPPTGVVLPKRRGRPPKNPHGLGAAIREVFRLADDELALAVHRADPAVRKRIAAALSK